MLKLIVAVLAITLAGSVNAAGWKDLRIDASSEAAFQQSLATFNRELSPERQQVFSNALMDIWFKSTAEAKADQRDLTAADFQRQLHGLSYEEVVTFTDPSGATAKERYREAKRMQAANPAPLPPLAVGPTSQGARAESAHQSLDSAELMRARQGGTVERTGRPCRGTSAGDCPGPYPR